MAGTGNEYGGWNSPQDGDHVSLPVKISGYVDTTYTGSIRVGVSLRRYGAEYYREKQDVNTQRKFNITSTNLLLGPAHIQGFIWRQDDSKLYFPDIDFIYVTTPPE